MSRIRYPAWLSGLLVVVGYCAASCAVVAAERPNILMIISDDHACRAVSAYGGGLNETPNIDRLARQGMRFERCYVTNSICGPSRACILTGKYSHQNGFRRNGDKFDGGQTTFPKLLQQAGYQTALIGKWHLESDPTGFDHWQILPGQGRYFSPEFITPQGRTSAPGYVTDVITDRAVQWLQQSRDAKKPFFLMVGHKAPHREWSPSDKHLADFADVTFPEPSTLFDDYRDRSSAPSKATMRIAHELTLPSDLKMYGPGDAFGVHIEKLMNDQQRVAWKATYAREKAAFDAQKPTGADLVRWKYQRYMHDYLRCVASVDDGVGKLLDALQAAGLGQNTVVIYTSDQGFFLGEHGWFDKRFMYEPSLRMPLLVRWPGQIAAGSVEQRIASNVDFAETFLDLAGVAIPAAMQGRSLVPLLRGAPPTDWRQSFYYHYYEGPPREHTVCEHCGVTDGRMKLIHYYKLDEKELFDLDDDPDEMRSVYAQPQYAAQRARLEAELAQLQTQLGVEADDPFR